MVMIREKIYRAADNCYDIDIKYVSDNRYSVVVVDKVNKIRSSCQFTNIGTDDNIIPFPLYYHHMDKKFSYFFLHYISAGNLTFYDWIKYKVKLWIMNVKENPNKISIEQRI